MTEASVQPHGRRWVTVLLVISVVVNVFLLAAIAGSAFSAREDRGAGARFEHAVAGLKLDANQQAAFRDFLKTLRQHTRAIREVNQAQWALLSDPKTDNAKIAELLNKSVEMRTANQDDIAAGLATFLTTLTAEQRVAFIESMRSEAGPRELPRMFRWLFRR